MRLIETRSGDYKYYTPEEAEEQGIEYKENWRDGNEGDWVLTNDDWVVRVLYRMRRQQQGQENGILRIATGTFATWDGVELHTEERRDRWTISGKSAVDIIKERDPTIRDKIFVKQFIETGDIKYAVNIAYNGRSRNAKERLSRYILANKKVRQLIHEKVQEALDKHGISHEWVVAEYMKLFKETEDEKNKIKILRDIRDIRGTNEKEQTHRIEGGFTGFNSKSVKAAKQEKLPESEDVQQEEDLDEDEIEERKEIAVKVQESIT